MQNIKSALDLRKDFENDFNTRYPNASDYLYIPDQEQYESWFWEHAQDLFEEKKISKDLFTKVKQQFHIK